MPTLREEGIESVVASETVIEGDTENTGREGGVFVSVDACAETDDGVDGVEAETGTSSGVSDWEFVPVVL